MKGPDCAQEVDEAKNAIKKLGGRLKNVHTYTIPGTDINHCIVEIEKISKTPSGYPRRFAKIAKLPL